MEGSHIENFCGQEENRTAYDSSRIKEEIRELDDMISRMEERCERQAYVEAQETDIETLRQTMEEERQSGAGRSALIICGAACCVLTAMFREGGISPWLPMLVAGLVLIAIGVVILLRQRRRSCEEDNAAIERMQRDLDPDREFILNTDNLVSEYLGRYGLPYEPFDALYRLHRIRDDISGSRQAESDE